MTGPLIIGFVVGLPLLLGLFLRVSASHLFFSLMAGELLARYFGHDLDPGFGDLALIVGPLLFTGFFLRGTLSGGTALLHIPPLFVTGLVLAAFVLPILPESLQTHVQTSQPGKWLLDLNRIIIGGVVVFQLVAFWLLNRLGHKSKH